MEYVLFLEWELTNEFIIWLQIYVQSLEAEYIYRCLNRTYQLDSKITYICSIIMRNFDNFGTLCGQCKI